MHEIWTISLREITRLSRRFSGAASPLIVVLLLGAIAFAAFTLRDSITPGGGLYRVGISGDGPSIQDNRFSVVKVDEAQGQRLLAEKAIDVLISGSQVSARQDDKSLFALQTLKLYLKQEELTRINAAYDSNHAFPLRVGIYYHEPASSATAQAGAAATPQIVAPQTSPDEIIIPSLTSPPTPFAQVVLALIFILPVTFISIFFTSSFMDEKINRRLTTLLSTPITPLQIILGKMIPYAIFATASTALIAFLTHADMLQAIMIYAPTTLFIFAIYLMVPLFYRTFKDTTFISMLVTTVSTAYLVFPAMFAGSNDLAYLSPLTLAVKMYRNEPYGWREYLFPSLPMLLIFCLSVYASTRLLNEEFLMTYRSLTRKLLDAVYMIIQRAHINLSVMLLSMLLVPAVYLIQVVAVVFASNLPAGVILAVVLITSAWVEEIIKSVGIYVLIEHGRVQSIRQILILAFLSAAGFLISEKLLVLVSVSAVSQLPLAGILFSNGGLFLVPLAAHFVFTSLVTLLTAKTRLPYKYVLILVALVHAFYNWYLMGNL